MGKAKPLSVDRAFRQAKTLALKGDTEAARAVYQEILDRFPQNTRAQEALAQLGRPAVKKRGGFSFDKAQEAVDLLEAGKYGKALDHATALLEAFPNVPFVNNLYGLLKGKNGDPDAALAYYRKAIELDPDFGEAHSNIGDALNQRGRADLALPHLEKAIPLMKDPTMGWNNLGTSYLHLGRFEEAREAYGKAIALKPRFTAAHRNLSLIKTYTENDPQIAEMGTMLQQQDMGAEDQAHLAFALSKACEDIGKDSHAFDLLAHGNRAMKSVSGYTTEGERKVFAKIKRFFQETPEPLPAGEGDGPRPIFVLGMPRSGTSLVEQIIASHSSVFGAGEMIALGQAVVPVMNDNEEGFARADLESIRAGYLGKLKAMGRPESVIVDKMPQNFRWIGFILAALPEATIVHTKRNPMAVGWSIYKQFFPAAGLSFTWDLSDIADYMDLYEDLMAFWHEKYPGRILDLQYEDLTENQEEESRRLIAHCGLDWEDACLEFHKSERAVSTASAPQIRKKMYKGSSDAWRKYEDRLEPLLRRAG